MNDRPEPDERRAALPRGSGQAYVLFAVSLLLVVTIGSVVQLRSISVGLVVTELALILLPAILFVRWKRVPVARALRWRSVTPGTAWLSVAVGLSGWGVAAGLHQLTLPILGPPPEIPGFQPETFPQLLLILACAALLPGICEETLFRGAIQGVLERRGPKQAVVITAVLFAVYHVSPWLLLPALFLGLVFGCLVVRTGSTVPAMIAHVANNAVALIAAYLLRDQPEAASYGVMAALAVAFCVAFPIFWRRSRAGGHDPPVLAPVLATVPARLSRPGAWIAGLVGGGLLLAVVAVLVAVFMLVDVHRMTSDALAPEIQRGDRLILRRSGILPMDIDVDDVVAVPRNGTTDLRRVTRVDEDTVWIAEGAAETAIPREEVEGKMVYRMATVR